MRSVQRMDHLSLSTILKPLPKRVKLLPMLVTKAMLPPRSLIFTFISLRTSFWITYSTLPALGIAISYRERDDRACIDRGKDGEDRMFVNSGCL